MKLNWVQHVIFRWTTYAFGPQFSAPKERVLRAVEEVVELAQALQVPKDLVVKVVNSVYERPAGDIGQEIGGALLTILATAEACKYSAERCLEQELARVLTTDVSKFRARNAEKVEAGLTREQL